MFKRVLIANRGEIACRIIWACHELGIETVAIFSEADREALHVQLADQAICIGPPAAAQSYLSAPAVISAAEVSDVDAIHPGYGFLAESAHFAEICQACNIKFIGPSPEIIRLMGDKAKARAAMKSAGIPILPGSDGVIEDEEAGRRVAREIGYPVMIKAAAGGGGRGMRIVRSEADLGPALKSAEAEAQAAFENGLVYIEKYIEQPRHIEFQLLADEQGHMVHLGERECSIQRRHQKLLEESPSPVVTRAMRERIGAVAVKAAHDLGYTNAGTMEFLFDGDQFYFMEMNTRIQVEHPVTEMEVNTDLVRAQILIAAGQAMEFTQDDVILSGHSIECRINAEDPDTFAPSPGTITALTIPGGPGVRVDSALYPGYAVPPFYDSLVAKVIVHARRRDIAIARMRRVLEGFAIEGIKTTNPLHLRILSDPDFIAGRTSTHFMERYAPGTLEEEGVTIPHGK